MILNYNVSRPLHTEIDFLKKPQKYTNNCVQTLTVWYAFVLNICGGKI